MSEKAPSLSKCVSVAFGTTSTRLRQTAEHFLIRSLCAATLHFANYHKTDNYQNYKKINQTHGTLEGSCCKEKTKQKTNFDNILCYTLHLFI